LELWKKKISESAIWKIYLANDRDYEKAGAVLGVSKEEVAYLIHRERCLWDFRYFADKHLFILPKVGTLQKFALNTPQRKLLAVRDKMRAQGKPVRIRMLKARQWGGSTLTQGLIFSDTVLRTGRRSMTIAHSMESAAHLRDMGERYYDNYNFPKPPLKKMSDKTWKMRHKGVESSMRIETAENVAAGHSLTINNLHASELQAWNNGETLLRGLLPTVPKDPDTMILEEGTGSGVGDFWYDRIQMTRSGETEWEFVFVAWWELDDTIKRFVDVEDKIRFEKSLDGEEKLLFEQGVSLERLFWRRSTLESDFKGDTDGFRQQYPADPDEAFLTSGRPVFNADKVKRKLQASKDPIKQGYFEKRKGEVVFIEDKKGYWKLWAEPILKVRNLYAMGEDTSEGLAIIKELGQKGSDYSAARVFQRDIREFVASFHARLDPDIVADEMELASIYFGGRESVGILPEQNAQGGGSVVIGHLKRRKDVRLIRTPIIGKRADDSKADEFGWETMKNTKRIAIDEMKEAIREDEYKDNDKDVWYECSTYVYDEKGRSNAQKGKYDDLVMATAITLQADKLMPMVFRPSEQKKVIYDRGVDIQMAEKISQDELMERSYAEF